MRGRLHIGSNRDKNLYQRSDPIFDQNDVLECSLPLAREAGAPYWISDLPCHAQARRDFRGRIILCRRRDGRSRMWVRNKSAKNPAKTPPLKLASIC